MDHSEDNHVDQPALTDDEKQIEAMAGESPAVARMEERAEEEAELDAETARSWGLVTEVVPAALLDDRVQAIAEMLAAAPRPAVQGTKVSLNLLERRAIAGEDLLQAQQLREAAAASLERREAVTQRKQSMSRRTRPEKK